MAENQVEGLQSACIGCILMRSFSCDSRSHRTEPRTLLNREIYSIVGAEAFRDLAAAFYRQLAQDDIIERMYPKMIWKVPKSACESS